MKVKVTNFCLPHTLYFQLGYCTKLVFTFLHVSVTYCSHHHGGIIISRHKQSIISR